MRPWLARLQPKAAGTRPDLPCAVRRVLRARAADGGPLRGMSVPFVGPHDGMTTLWLEEPRRPPLSTRRYEIGPDGVGWYLLPPAAEETRAW